MASFPIFNHHLSPFPSSLFYSQLTLTSFSSFQNHEPLNPQPNSERKQLENFFLYRQYLLKCYLQETSTRKESSQIEPTISQQTLKEEDIKEENSSLGNSLIQKVEESELKLEISDFGEEDFIPKKEENEEDENRNDLRFNITLILNYFMENFGKKTDREMLIQKTTINLEIFRRLFDALNEKFDSAKKCREDMSRFILRKAITSMRDTLRGQLKLSAKAASVILCKRYFGAQYEDLKNEEVDGTELNNQEEKLLSFLLPYKKNSRNKTANTSFITEIFTSEQFYEDYLEFLGKLKEILNNENKKKIGKFIEFLVDCVEKNQLHKIKYFKRLPWVNAWNESTYVIAQELLHASKWKLINKKPKKSKAKKVKTDVLHEN